MHDGNSNTEKTEKLSFFFPHNFKVTLVYIDAVSKTPLKNSIIKTEMSVEIIWKVLQQNGLGLVFEESKRRKDSMMLEIWLGKVGR